GRGYGEGGVLATTVFRCHTEAPRREKRHAGTPGVRMQRPGPTMREDDRTVALRWPAGLAEPAKVVRDDPVARGHQGGDLLLPGRAAERPAVHQDDGSARSVVLVVEVDGARVLPADRDAAHHAPSRRCGRRSHRKGVKFDRTSPCARDALGAGPSL